MPESNAPTSYAWLLPFTGGAILGALLGVAYQTVRLRRLESELDQTDRQWAQLLVEREFGRQPRYAR